MSHENRVVDTAGPELPQRLRIPGLLLALLLAPHLAAQQPRRTLGGHGYVDPAEMLARLERGTVERLSGSRSYYTDAQRQMLLDGVGRLARQGKSSEAFVILWRIGVDPQITTLERREIPRQLLRIYRQSKERFAKSYCLMMLGDLLAHTSPPEAPEIIQVQVEAATAAPTAINGIGHQALPTGPALAKGRGSGAA